MDIDLLSKMVKELILNQDRVVLPGLGSFVAEIVPSSFSDKGYTINPPYRRLFFRSKPDEGNDLIEFYAASNKLEVEIAENILRDYLKELQEVLHEKKIVIFPGLGRLRATKENNLFFVSDENLDIYPEGFGLEPVSLKTHQETSAEVTAVVQDLKSMMIPDAPVQAIATDGTVPVENMEDVAEEISVLQEPEAADAGAAEESMPAETAEIEVEKEEEVEEVAVQEEVVVPESETEVESSTFVPVWKKIVKIFIWTAVAAILLLLVYMAIGHLYPEFVDSFLYSPEELEIVNIL